MIRNILLGVMIVLSCDTAAFSQSQNQVLMKRCIDSFEIIKNRDLEAFIGLMPYSPSEEEKSYAKELLERKYQKWFVKNGKITSITERNVIYQEPSDSKVKKFGADNKARAKIRVALEKLNSNTSCSFIHTSRGWFLSKLP